MTDNSSTKKRTADFTFVTTNDHKELVARIICDKLGVAFERKDLELTEIQDDDGTVIAVQKAQQAYKACKSPVVVTDTSWSIHGLNGFPGPYMKQVNQRFTTTDFLNLTKPLTDRQVTYRQILVYKDAQREKIFAVDIPGILLKTARGDSVYPSFPIISFDGGKYSLAEADAIGRPSSSEHRNEWHDLCEWVIKNRHA